MASMLSDDELDRYARHIVLKEIGGAGQMRLKAAKVLLIGAGGIGAPAALYLSAAGVGTIGLIDDDTVSLSNLQRQVIFRTEDIDTPKVEAAAAHLKALNPHSEIVPLNLRLTEANAADIIGDYDMVLDGCDNFETRHLVSRTCLALNKPLISAALGRFSGQVSVFVGKPCYQCLVPDIPPDAETCERMGIVGALAGIIGTMAALEVIKLLTGAGQTLIGKLLIFDGLTLSSRIVSLPSEPDCPACGQ
ncbi:MAG: molybdopterin-synthase adenylyltransferase MoeB [Asticcacaulis sp.]